MPVNRYDDPKVSLRRPHGNGDLDIIRASYIHRKANLTEAIPVAKSSPWHCPTTLLCVCGGGGVGGSD